MSLVSHPLRIDYSIQKRCLHRIEQAAEIIGIHHLLPVVAPILSWHLWFKEFSTLPGAMDLGCFVCVSFRMQCICIDDDDILNVPSLVALLN